MHTSENTAAFCSQNGSAYNWDCTSWPYSKRVAHALFTALLSGILSSCRLYLDCEAEVTWCLCVATA